jgi:anti-anti-sigma factor
MENPEVRSSFHVSAPTYEGESCIVCIAGDLDAATAPFLQDALAPTLAAPEIARLTLDMAAVTFVDSPGWRVLLHARVTLAARGAELVLASCPPNLVKVLEETKMNLLFDRIP